MFFRYSVLLAGCLCSVLACSVTAEAGFTVSTGFNNRTDWNTNAVTQPYFHSPGYISGPQSGQAKINPIIASAMGVSDPNNFLIYKDNRGGSEEGNALIKAAYSTTYSNNDNNATITRIAGATAQIYTHVPTYLYLKDGKAKPNWYLFDITGKWNGIDALVVEDFFVGYSISHVSIYGGSLDAPPQGLTAVPEPASIAVWGSVLAVGGLLRRRRTQSR
ncbi:MAG: hypothetical protein JNL58_31430 [Planctomyces sp.]|nr:hypothetical protein [Planctomyces sp.]